MYFDRWEIEMNKAIKNETIKEIIELLSSLLDDESTSFSADKKTSKPPSDRQDIEQLEMLPIKKCTELVKGLSEHTIRTLVAQKKIKYLRCGQGERGKILIDKQSLIEYCNTFQE